MSIGTGDVGLITSLAVGGVVSVLAFLGRGVLSDLRGHDRRLAEHDTAFAVAKGERVHERVTKLEDTTNEIRGDLREVKGDVSRILSLLEHRESEPHNRRHDDHEQPKDN